MKDKIMKWYKQGLWSADMVSAAVTKGVITPEDYESITGKVFVYSAMNTH